MTWNDAGWKRERDELNSVVSIQCSMAVGTLGLMGVEYVPCSVSGGVNVKQATAAQQ